VPAPDDDATRSNPTTGQVPHVPTPERAGRVTTDVADDEPDERPDRPADLAAEGTDRPADRAEPVTDAPLADAPGASPDEPRATVGPSEPAEPTVDRFLRRLLGDATLALDATRRSRVLGWLLPLAVTLFGGILRFWHLGNPHNLVFDETYYVKDAYSLLHQGYEGNWNDNPNPGFEHGDMTALRTDGEYVVHPQVGKWMIAIGMWLGGGPSSSTAWRLSAAVVGTLAILMVARIGRRLFASTALGTIAGLLLAVDGEAIVQSRISLLDPFLMFFVLAAFGALLLDREQARRRLAARAAALVDAGEDLRLGLGPRLGTRWWRLAAAALLGLSMGVKWSGIYFLAVFGLLSVVSDMHARWAVGIRRWFEAGIRRDGILAGVSMVGISAAVYVASWFGWFTHSQAYDRQWAAANPGQGVTWLPPALRSFVHYHQEMWRFHNGLDTPHSYAAHPLGWIVQYRPTSMWYPTSVSGLSGDAARSACHADQCSQAITAIGNPVLWWGVVIAIIAAVVWFVRTRDWRAVAVLSGIAAGWLPWFLYAHRTIFTFYSVAFVPWVALTVAYVLGLVIGPKDQPERQRRWATWGVGVYVGLAVVIGLFFYPIWSAWTVPWWFWHAHMWMTSWI
jgi:dolichyl-phosphate-mannose-protein mannosyltransferase